MLWRSRSACGSAESGRGDRRRAPVTQNDRPAGQPERPAGRYAGSSMSVLYIAIPVALGIAGLALWAFARSVREGQLDDLETPAMRILHDDDARPPES